MRFVCVLTKCARSCHVGESQRPIVDTYPSCEVFEFGVWSWCRNFHVWEHDFIHIAADKPRRQVGSFSYCVLQSAVVNGRTHSQNKRRKGIQLHCCQGYKLQSDKFYVLRPFLASTLLRRSNVRARDLQGHRNSIVLQCSRALLCLDRGGTHAIRSGRGPQQDTVASDT